jgi:hypothetical protein
VSDPPPRLHRDASVLRYQERVEPKQLASIDHELIEAVSSHISRHFGSEVTVLHEVVSDLVHIDIYLVPPAVDRQWITVLTSGMAERAMAAPPEATECRYAELLLALPPDWQTDEKSLRDEWFGWPFQLLAQLARFPHEYRTWLWLGHSMPNGDPPKAYASGTGLAGSMIGPAALVPSEFWKLTAGTRDIYYFAVYPLHQAEMRYKLRHGWEALFRKLVASGVTELIQPVRSSVVGSRLCRLW